MIAFPNCKINLGLRIIRKRDDGFHDLETVFYPVSLKDVLEILPLEQPESETKFIISGRQIPGSVDENLCLKAYYLLKRDYPELPAIRMQLHKNIPMGSGLGGGSADATCTLKMLNKLFNLEINMAGLERYALQLGSDCPFFLYNYACHASGRGEVLEPIKTELDSWQILLVHPGIHINTGWAFSKINPSLPGSGLKEIISQPIDTWENELVNDFEKICIETYPLLRELKEQLYRKGAAYVAMSGSGSSFYALFPEATIVDTSDIHYAWNML